MFETLNDRGLWITQADLVKNYLFAESDNRIKEAQQRWSSMRGTLEATGEDITLTYLRHLVISRYGYTRERDVLERIRAEAKGRVQAIDFLDNLAESASAYVAIQTAEHAKWNQNPKDTRGQGNMFSPSIRGHIRTLGMLRVTVLRPLMLAVANQFSKTNIEETFRMFVCWSVRLLVAGGGRSGSVEQSCAERAKDVSTGHIKTAKDLAKAMTNIIPTDAAFEASFAIARVSQNYLARYYLRALELKRKGHQEPEWIPNDDIVINLEHVIPENPDSSWKSLDSETVPAYHKRIGNLVLLQASKNVAAGNSSFAGKKKLYAQSTFKLTADIASKSGWGPQEIDKRQKTLAALAVKTWPIIPA
jgi:hypothetical protein